MTTKRQNSEVDTSTHEAWDNLQKKLANEPVNDKWENWGAIEQKVDLTPPDRLSSTAADPAAHAPAEQMKESTPLFVDTRRRRGGRRWKWTTAAVAAVIVGTVLVTPMGNNALAAILNQFKVQEIATVDGESIENMLNQLVPGESASRENVFGQFSTESGSIEGQFTREQATARLGVHLLPAKLLGTEEDVYVTPSHKIMMKLNVNELNHAMQRVGATKLLPESMDGKEVVLNIHEGIMYDMSTDDQHWASLRQMQSPEFLIDPSVDMTEAVEAVLQLPILPSDLKEQLQQSGILTGSIPMPYVVDQASDIQETMIAGTKVLIEQRQYNQLTDHIAVWVKNGQLFHFQGGSAYEEEAEFMNKLKELVEA
ncbi:hypothetical protein D3C74_80910 [compost metagenome]